MIKVEVPELRSELPAANERLDWDRVLGPGGPVEIEIGIGKGRFLLAAARARPEIRHFGIEWANKYLRIAELRAHRDGLANIRFVRADARAVISAIPDNSVSAYYVFYPDPWPKLRHHKRRFLGTTNVAELARTLVPDGLLHVATDHADYWQAIQVVLELQPEFTRLSEFGGDRFPLPTDEPLTNFEAKYRDQGRNRFRASWIWRGIAGSRAVIRPLVDDHDPAG